MSEYEKIIENINPTIQDVIKDIDDNKMDIFRAGIYADNGEQFISSYQVKKVLEHLANPKLNKNQQVVLDLLKYWQEKWPSWHVSTTINYLTSQNNEYHDALNKKEENQVFYLFTIWVIEQEGE
ncbi:MAG: hypothetical protein LKF42_00500 [Streptococcaceae bacterium]|jgi:hypothetical protein|nr:hypothetical protein [Streptococcaceae bacterium]MCH4176212.1 hypothetical protein [Streptococcaceae bacterium]